MLSLTIFKNELLFKPLQICNTLLGIGSAIYYVACIHLIINAPLGQHSKFSDGVYIIFMISVLLGHSTACVVFVVGILKWKRDFIFPWLFSQIIFSIVVVVSFAYESFFERQSTLTIIWSLIQACIWLCGYALYQNTSGREAEYDEIPTCENNKISGMMKLNETKNCEKIVLEYILSCIPLRFGNIFFGVLQTYISLMAFIYVITNACFSFSYFNLNSVTMIILSFIHFIFCSFFIIGISKKIKNMLLPWLCSHLIMTTILAMKFQFNLGAGLAVIWIAIQTFIWFCGYSYHHRTHRKSDTISNTSEEFDLFPDVKSLKTVLFCVPLRIGNLILGFMGAVIYLALGIYLITQRSHNVYNFNYDYRTCNTYQNYNSGYYDYKDCEHLYYVSMIGIFLIHSIGCATFVVGILKRSMILQIHWLFSQCLMIIVPVIVFIVIAPRALYEADFSIAVNWIIIQANIWCCGYSLYKSYSKMEGSNYILPLIGRATFTNKLSL